MKASVTKKTAVDLKRKSKNASSGLNSSKVSQGKISARSGKKDKESSQPAGVTTPTPPLQAQLEEHEEPATLTPLDFSRY